MVLDRGARGAPNEGPLAFEEGEHRLDPARREAREHLALHLRIAAALGRVFREGAPGDRDRLGRRVERELEVEPHLGQRARPVDREQAHQRRVRVEHLEAAALGDQHAPVDGHLAELGQAREERIAQPLLLDRVDRLEVLPRRLDQLVGEGQVDERLQADGVLPDHDLQVDVRPVLRVLEERRQGPQQHQEQGPGGPAASASAASARARVRFLQVAVPTPRGRWEPGRGRRRLH
jgi:hypothetical protein